MNLTIWIHVQLHDRLVHNDCVPLHNLAIFNFLNKKIFGQEIQWIETFAIFWQLRLIFEDLMGWLFENFDSKIIAVTESAILTPEEERLVEVVHD